MYDTAVKPATTYPAIVGEILAQMRNQRGLHQSQLAQALGITQSTLSRIEKGQSGLSVEHLRLAALHLGSTPATILGSADQAEIMMNLQGIVITPTRNNDEFNKTLVLIGAMALAAAITVAILKTQRT